MLLFSFTQAKRRLELELEASDPQDLKDGGGGPTKAKKPMEKAPLSHKGGKSKTLYSRVVIFRRRRRSVPFTAFCVKM